VDWISSVDNPSPHRHNEPESAESEANVSLNIQFGAGNLTRVITPRMTFGTGLVKFDKNWTKN